MKNLPEDSAQSDAYSRNESIIGNAEDPVDESFHSSADSAAGGSNVQLSGPLGAGHGLDIVRVVVDITLPDANVCAMCHSLIINYRK